MGLRKLAMILAKEESTYGTDPTPDATNNAFLAYNPQIRFVGDNVERDPVRETISLSPGIMGSRRYELSFETEYYGSNAAGTAPRWGDLLEACSMSETVVGGTSVTYKPNSLGTGAKSVTIYAYFDGRMHELNGAVGNVELVVEAGKPARLRWTFHGLYVAGISAAVPSSPTFETLFNAPPKAESSSLTFNSLSTLVCRQLSLNLGNQVASRADVNGATGYKGFAVTNRKGAGSMTLEAFPPSTYDIFADVVASTLRQLSFVLGSGAGKVLTVTCPKVQLLDVQQGDGDGIELFEVTFALAYNAGNDEITLALT